MKTKIKLLSALALISVLFASCATCDKPFQEGRSNSEQEQCGFGDDLGEIEQDIETVAKTKAPAANRAVVTQNEEQIQTAEFTESKSKDLNRSEVVKDKNDKKSSVKETLKSIKDVIKDMKSKKSSGGDDMKVLLIILCFFIPWLSVGIYTGWDLKLTLITLLLWFLLWLPGVIFGLLVLLDYIG